MENRVKTAFNVITYILNANGYQYDNSNWALDNEMWFKKDDFFAYISLGDNFIEFSTDDLSIMPRWLTNFGKICYGDELAMFDLWI